jgi:outer membrane protein OmpA-like peptidoglycan-associated protein
MITPIGKEIAMHAQRPLRTLLALCAFGVAAGWAAVGLAAGEPSAQEIHDRLLGHDTGATTQPPAGGDTGSASQPDCSTQEALENNPACFNQVSGSSRSFSLVAPHSDTNTTPKPAAPASHARPTSQFVRAPGRPAAAARAAKGGGAAASCGLRDTSSASGVNLCVTFALNSAALTPQSRSSLDILIQALSAPDIRGRTVLIGGFADASGNAQANQKLSEARAASVADYLAQHGVARSLVESHGYGATQLLPDRAPTDPANRRVEARLKQ